MEFEIYGKDIRITKQLRGHIERRLCFALERFARRIRRVRVSLGDLNGPRGGVDKHCRVTVVLVSSTVIVIEDRDSSIYAAIARVADKAGVCIGRRLERHKGGGKYMKISRLLSQERIGRHPRARARQGAPAALVGTPGGHPVARAVRWRDCCVECSRG